ncbi:hypothetical protein V9K67_17690 [Paraflavisolibacter sp. H34]|uniref:hypothetical protein n=1 Tax=Huijunlia imazamoxiresistens TaxID=3127457 RepID=UPI003017310D
MKANTPKKDKEELAAALGAPKYYLEAPGMVEGETYAWFPNIGDSMTDGTDRSIPGGSLVLGRWLPMKSVADIPLHRPIIVILDDGGVQYCLLKSCCALHDGPGTEAGIWLRSYNPAPRCDDFWMPFVHIKFVFVVERVRLPDGREFVPRQEEVIRKGSGS